MPMQLLLLLLYQKHNKPRFRLTWLFDEVRFICENTVKFHIHHQCSSPIWLLPPWYGLCLCLHHKFNVILAEMIVPKSASVIGPSPPATNGHWFLMPFGPLSLVTIGLADQWPTQILALSFQLKWDWGARYKRAYWKIKVAISLISSNFSTAMAWPYCWLSLCLT